MIDLVGSDRPHGDEEGRGTLGSAREARHCYTDDDRALIAQTSRTVLCGSPGTVADQLRAVVTDTGADELMVTSPIHDHADRRRSYELLTGATVASALAVRRAGPAGALRR